MKKKLITPKFKNEDEEQDFWTKTDIGDYFSSKDFTKATFPNLKKSKIIHNS